MNNKHLLTGKMGEDLVNSHILKKGHIVLGRNVRYKCGELDIVSYYCGVIHFIEVKSARVIRETTELSVMPEENMTPKKVLRLKRSIEVYLSQNRFNPRVMKWQFDLYAVVIHETTGEKAIVIYEDIIL